MDSKPYISFVVTSRNDNHGGDMLHRMQIFLSGLLQQCKRFSLPCELIIVEWNPIPGEKMLSEVLDWQMPDSPCAVRFIEIPNHLHLKLKNSKNLPLFQMIAKNVGIRRARGEFICATNIDIIFNDALFERFSSRDLKDNEMYRINRYDADREVPVGVGLEKQIAYCDNNIIRVNARARTIPYNQYLKELEAKKYPLVIPSLINETPVEAEEPFDSATEIVKPSVLAKSIIAIRHFWWEFKSQSPVWNFGSSLIPPPFKAALFDDELLGNLAYYSRDWNSIIRGLKMLGHKREKKERKENASISKLRELYKRSYSASLSLLGRLTGADQYFEIADLHTNGCGDFTMLSHSTWMRLRGYDEYNGFSWHLDSVFCHAAAAAGVKELVFDEPCRIYHIEHGSGWTPESQAELFARLKRKRIPYLTNNSFGRIAEAYFKGKKAPVSNPADWGFAAYTLKELNSLDSKKGSDESNPVAEQALLSTPGGRA